MPHSNCDELPSPPKNILYVVFHGELAFFDSWNSGYIHVYAPNVSTHIYMAGPWLAERHIPAASTLKLEGVQHGESTISGCKIIRLGKNSEVRPVSARFEIRLPRPDAILDGMAIDGTIKIGENAAPIAQRMDLRPVFKYNMNNDIAFLTDLDDEKQHDPGPPAAAKNWGAGMGCPGYYSLHIFAEEDSLFSDDETHAVGAFRLAGHVLGVNNVVVGQTGDNPELGIIPGLHPSETLLTLAQRTSILAGLGRQLRKGHTYLHWDMTPETKRDVLTSNNHSSCGPVGN